MKNPLTFKVEAWLGILFVVGVSVFLVVSFWTMVKNASSEADTINYAGVKLNTVSPEEKVMIDQWLTEHENLGVTAADGYRNIIRKFPDRPWILK